MEGIKLIPYIILIIAIAGIIAGASTIMVAKFGDTMTACYNSSYTLRADNGACLNASPMHINGPNVSVGQGGLNLSDEYFIKAQTQDGVTTVAEQIPTVAIIAIMVIIISIIAGVFFYTRYFA